MKITLKETLALTYAIGSVVFWAFILSLVLPKINEHPLASSFVIIAVIYQIASLRDNK